MSERNYVGISFPFRIGVKGGVTLSIANTKEVPHIVESMEQILKTSKYERTMEPQIYSDIDTEIFEPNDSSTSTMLEYQIRDALRRLEPRISVIKVDILSEQNQIFAEIKFRVLPYDSDYVTTIKVGDFDGVNSYS